MLYHEPPGPRDGVVEAALPQKLVEVPCALLELRRLEAARQPSFAAAVDCWQPRGEGGPLLLAQGLEKGWSCVHDVRYLHEAEGGLRAEKDSALVVWEPVHHPQRAALLQRRLDFPCRTRPLPFAFGARIRLAWTRPFARRPLSFVRSRCGAGGHCLDLLLPAFHVLLAALHFLLRSPPAPGRTSRCHLLLHFSGSCFDSVRLRPGFRLPLVRAGPL